MLVKRKEEKKRKFPEPAAKPADSPAVPEFAGCIFSEVRYVKGVSVSGWGPPVQLPGGTVRTANDFLVRQDDRELFRAVVEL